MAWLTVLGIPAAVYVMCITAIMFLVTEKPQNLFILIGTVFLTSGIYIFHRTTILEVGPMQKRHVIALSHKKVLFIISLVLLVFATTAFAMYRPLTTVLVVCSLVGVIAYGRKTIIRPLRMYPYVKPLVVGTAIALYGWVLNDYNNSFVTVLAFILICSADALTCDVVDSDYDTASGCHTLAIQLGKYWTWMIASVAFCFASIVLLFAIEQTQIGLYLFITFVVSLVFRKYDARYVVDLRLGLVLLLAWVECQFWIGLL